MEKVITIHLEKLPEGLYLATSNDIQGLVAQGRTVWETLEIARDVSRKLLEQQKENSERKKLKSVTKSFDMPMVVEG
jgi:predicted RNase H-like HicB family nuclease